MLLSGSSGDKAEGGVRVDKPYRQRNGATFAVSLGSIGSTIKPERQTRSGLITTRRMLLDGIKWPPQQRKSLFYKHISTLTALALYNRIVARERDVGLKYRILAALKCRTIFIFLHKSRRHATYSVADGGTADGSLPHSLLGLLPITNTKVAPAAMSSCENHGLFHA